MCEGVEFGSMGSRRAAGGGARCPSRWQRGRIHPRATAGYRSAHAGRTARRGAAARDGSATTGGTIGASSSLGLERLTPARRHQGHFVSLRDGCATLDADEPVLRDGLCEGAGEM